MADLTGTTIDRYEILGRLGEGGMAVVYKALHARLQSEVAIKVIRPEKFPPEILDQMLKRFEREAAALARLKHAHIVTVHDFGEYENTPYLVMEYLPGGTLRQRMGEPLPPSVAASLLQPVAAALAYAHTRGIVHRDVKPVNILFTETGEPKLSDFGIARLLGVEDATNLTATGMGVGTPAYMAPEQWKGQASPAVDIYALGVVLYELLTGRLPYDATTPGELIEQMLTRPLPDPRISVPGLPNAAVAVVQTALQRKPEDRFESMAAFAAALSAIHTTPMEQTVAQTPFPLPFREVPGIGTDSGPTLPTSTPPPAVDSGPTLGTPTPPPSPVPSPAAVGQPGRGPDKPYVYVQAPPRPFPWLPILIGTALVFLLIFVLWPNGPLAAALFPTATPVETDGVPPTPTPPFWEGPGAGMPSATFTPLPPTATRTPTAPPEPTATDTPQPTPTPSHSPGDTQVSAMDGMTMAYIPAGTFEMGVPIYDGHTVTLSAFWMDTTEVTNAMYRQCVEAGQCTSPSKTSYYYLDSYSDHPVVYVSWDKAAAYCTWADRRLPTEAEWEYAARGGLEGKLYPWGDDAPVCTDGAFNEAQFGNCSPSDTVPVASFFPNGYGLYDMAGNVWEWVNDWYDNYPSGNVANPTGPSSGTDRVLRGGFWDIEVYLSLRVAYRSNFEPSSESFILGFRCASSP